MVTVEEGTRTSKTKVMALVTAVSPFLLMLLNYFEVDVPPELVTGFLVSAGSLLAFFFRDAMDRNSTAGPRVYDGRRR